MNEKVNNEAKEQNLKIIAYLKPQCGWSNGVRAIMNKYQLEYEDRDIINSQEQYEEMVAKSRQPLSPCVEINGHMLADVSGEEVETWMIEQGLVEENSKEVGIPINKPCHGH